MSSVICIASGPSLTRADLGLCERSGIPLLGINSMYMLASHLDYHYAGDTSWWYEHYDYTHEGSLKLSMKASKKDEGHPRVIQMERGFTEGFSTQWPIICTGKNSGYAAVNLAYLLGFKRIILLGYDMQFTGGKKHCHPDHINNKNPSEYSLSEFIRIFNKNAQRMFDLGLEILNATRSTALQCFPRVRLEEVL